MPLSVLLFELEIKKILKLRRQKKIFKKMDVRSVFGYKPQYQTPSLCVALELMLQNYFQFFLFLILLLCWLLRFCKNSKKES